MWNTKLKTDFYKQGPFQEIAGYRFRKAIFRYAVGLMFLLFVLVLASTGFSFEPKVYFSCPLDAPGGYCENPFYKECLHNPSSCPFNIDYPELAPEFERISDQYKLPAGFSVGTPPPFLVKNFGAFVSLIILMAFVINHLLYNKGYDFKSKGKKLVKEMNEED